MSKREKLNKANDNIPDDELYLAKLIQNAKSVGAVAIQGSYYQHSNGNSMGKAPPAGRIAGCCSVGAAMLSPDTEREAINYSGLVGGNDYAQQAYWFYSTEDPGEVVGYAYWQACSSEE